MEYGTLYELITGLSYGTKLYIGVCFFGNNGNKKCELPHEYSIHAGNACCVLKRCTDPKRCYRCRKMAIRKAVRTKESFGGCCINGVYEYTRPVVIDDEVICVIYVGNIFAEEGRKKLEKYPVDISCMEHNFSYEQCDVLGNLIEGYIRTLLEKYPDTADRFNPLVKNIKSYLNENLEYDVSVSYLSELFHYNAVYLGRIFKKETGMSIKEYVNIERIKKAQKLLWHNESITGTAQQCGFNNVTYFNGVFKKCTGITPSEYKKMVKEGL